MTITATDSAGAVATATFRLEVRNVDPAAAVTNNGPLVYGQTAAVTVSAPSDPSTDDTAAGFHYEFSATGDFTGVTYATAAGTSPSLSVAGLPAGDHTFDVRVIDKDDGFTQYSTTVKVNPASTATAAAVAVPTPLFGVDGVTLTATVSVVAPGAGVPTGTVTFYDGVTPLGTVAVNGRGGASLTLGSSALAAGPHTIRAVYSGEANFRLSEGTTTLSVVAPSGIQGLAYVDFNNDGQVDFGEKALAGVTVTLTGTDDRGQAVSRTATPWVPSAAFPVGTAANDSFSGIVIGQGGLVAENYNFGERPAAGGAVTGGLTAAIGYWQNKNGQDLILSLNGGPGATQLGDWLAATFPNMYANLAGKTNAQVAAFYKELFARTAHTAPGGPPKTDAQVMATALAVSVTNRTLAGTAGIAYGFTVSEDGLGTRTFNVGSSGGPSGWRTTPPPRS